MANRWLCVEISNRMPPPNKTVFYELICNDYHIAIGDLSLIHSIVKESASPEDDIIEINFVSNKMEMQPPLKRDDWLREWKDLV